MTDSAMLERILVDADPARTPRDATPDARALIDRDRIVRRARPRRTSAPLIGWAGGLTAVAASAAIAVAVLLPQNAAVAGTPSPLSFEDAGSVDEIVADARATLAAAGSDAPQRSVRSASWSFAVDLGSERTEIVPELVSLDWATDRSGVTVAVEGEPYDPEDAEANVGAEVSSSGDVAWRVEMAPGEFSAPVVELNGSGRDEVLDILHAYWLPTEYTATDVVIALTSVLGQWTPSNAQEAEMIGILAEMDGVEALGATTDRLGRPATGVRVVTPDGTASDVVLISDETGRIAGIERTWLGEDGVFPTGGIISYQLWDVDEGVLR